MSRIGKKPILIPGGVEVKIEDSVVTVRGPKGEIQKEILPELQVELKEGKIFLSPKIHAKKARAFWGLFRQLLFNMIRGVTDGFETRLIIEGVGYRASLEGETLVLQMGFTHPVKISPPKGIKFSVEKNIITVSGPDKEVVGQIAAKIRAVRPPEPYKGKGIRYQQEQVRRKAGKKAVGTVK
jgi:large subunit ribosomal protein L6